MKSPDFTYLFFFFFFTFYVIFLLFNFEIISDLQGIYKNSIESSHILSRSTGDWSPRMLTFNHACFINLHVSFSVAS